MTDLKGQWYEVHVNCLYASNSDGDQLWPCKEKNSKHTALGIIMCERSLKIGIEVTVKDTLTPMCKSLLVKILKHCKCGNYMGMNRLQLMSVLCQFWMM